MKTTNCQRVKISFSKAYLKKTVFFLLALFNLSGCQIGYIYKSAKGQLSLLTQRVPIEDALLDPKISEEEKNRIRITQEVKKFAEENLYLNSKKNYSHYVSLDRPYVVYAVSASPKWELKHHTWWFPIVGSVPYKGFFNEEDARSEEDDLKKENLDTYNRGVSAYSTLGWFNDPLLSSMTKFRETDLVNTIIHESVHATIYLNGSADFNERLAVFIANFGTLEFYKNKEGTISSTVQRIQNEYEDEKKFSNFISKEISELEQWYQKQQNQEEDLRVARIQEIQNRFKKFILPNMKTDYYSKFSELKLNNARILLYKTYVSDLAFFETLFEKNDHDIKKFLNACKALN